MPKTPLFLCLALFAPLPAMAFGTCSDPGYLANFAVDYPVTSCELRDEHAIQINGDPVNIRFISLNGDGHADDSAWIGYLEGVLDRVAINAEAMGPGVALEDVTILLSSHDSFDAGRPIHGEAFLNRLAGECPITVFKLPDAVGLERAGSTLAHEIFHCIQDVTWSAQELAPGSAWWVEGSAEYFGSSVVLESDSSDGFIRQFSPDSQIKTLHGPAMTYQNVVFFDWLHQQSGPAGVGAFLNGMASDGNHLGALQAQLPLDRWASFVEQYLTVQVTDPAGQTISPQRNLERVTADQDTGDIRRQTDAYMMHRIGLVLPSGGSYELSVDAGPDVRSRLLTDGAWADFPQQISTCDGEKRMTVYALTTTGPQAVTLRYVKSPCSACQVATVRDSCLAGTWLMTGGGPIEWMRDQGMQSHIRVQASEMSVRMLRNGDYVLNPVTVQVEADNDGNPVTGDGQSVGLSGTWSGADGVLNICPLSGEILATVRTGSSAGTSMLFGPGGDMVMGYQCSGNTLTTTLAIPDLPPMETTYTRQ